ncbi:MAG: hypothetical protein Q9162_007141 [Coniocarpon cinnabarinum]
MTPAESNVRWRRSHYTENLVVDRGDSDEMLDSRMLGTHTQESQDGSSCSSESLLQSTLLENNKPAISQSNLCASSDRQARFLSDATCALLGGQEDYRRSLSTPHFMLDPVWDYPPPVANPVRDLVADTRCLPDGNPSGSDHHPFDTAEQATGASSVSSHSHRAQSVLADREMISEPASPMDDTGSWPLSDSDQDLISEQDDALLVLSQTHRNIPWLAPEGYL